MVFVELCGAPPDVQHVPAPASRPAPSRCSSSSMVWASCQSAEVSAVRMWSEAALDSAGRMDVGEMFITRLIEHFGALLFG